MHPVANYGFSYNVTCRNLNFFAFMRKSDIPILLRKVVLNSYKQQKKHARHHRTKEFKLALLASQSIHKHKQGKFTIKL